MTAPTREEANALLKALLARHPEHLRALAHFGATIYAQLVIDGDLGQSDAPCGSQIKIHLKHETPGSVSYEIEQPEGPFGTRLAQIAYWLFKKGVTRTSSDDIFAEAMERDADRSDPALAQCLQPPKPARAGCVTLHIPRSRTIQAAVIHDLAVETQDDQGRLDAALWEVETGAIWKTPQP